MSLLKKTVILIIAILFASVCFHVEQSYLTSYLLSATLSAPLETRLAPMFSIRFLVILKRAFNIFNDKNVWKIHHIIFFEKKTIFKRKFRMKNQPFPNAKLHISHKDYIYLKKNQFYLLCWKKCFSYESEFFRVIILNRKYLSTTFKSNLQWKNVVKWA